MIRLKSLLKEEAVVKNKKTGNVYTVQQFDPAKHIEPTPAEIQQAKAKNGGRLPKQGESEPTHTPKNSEPETTWPVSRSYKAGILTSVCFSDDSNFSLSLGTVIK